MCGIAGIVNKNGRSVTEDEIKKFTDLVSHRGPDDSGYFLKNNFALGHRRLSILDISSAGHQPMRYLNVKITFNGEIYNYIEIREELSQLGYTFKTGTDTEVIAASYIEWDVDCVNRFNGMWSFAIYDESKEVLFCSRDRFGIKPFYFVDNSLFFAFGSEIKQLHFLGFNNVNLQVLFDFLYLGYKNHTNGTFFKDVQQLEPSHNLIFNLKTNEVSIGKYYTLQLNSDISALDQKNSELLYQSQIKNSISLRLRSDVKVGTCLSGGLDSSYIAAVASQFYKEKSRNNFTSITAKSGDQQNDETVFAKMVIEKSKLDGIIIEPSLDHILEDLDKIVYHQEEPFGSSSIFMQYYVMKAAKESGCIVLLDGQGGDETLLGYERYYMSFLRSMHIASRIRWFKKISRNSKLTSKDAILYYLYFNFPYIRRRHLLKRMRDVKKEFNSFFDDSLILEYANASRKIDDLQKLEIGKTQLRSLLNYEDKNAMAWSVETRLPFLDYKVVEAAISIKPEYKINDGWSKYILRQISSEVLPPEVIWRKNKIGFEAPSSFANFSSHFNSIIQHSSILKHIFKSTTEFTKPTTDWKLLSIALWEKRFKMHL